ncbi:MAG: nickel pincer cofactor biosynthesis protein LarC [Clostridia bacterium]|nr:nickel pincer cofactor biosynthesis protein LarC [Clostridia bacterium]
MKTLYLDLGMGAAGDMLSAALYELLDLEGRAAFLARMEALGLENVVIEPQTVTRSGIRGTHMKVTVNGTEEGEETHEHHHEHHHDHEHDHHHDHEHEHEHHHDHDHHHHHSSLGDINAVIAGLPVSEKVKSDMASVYSLIAEAESEAHGVPVTDIHFHEVGTLDAVADIAAVSILIETLAPDRIVCSAVHVGSGSVRCAHGVLPVPAPATAHILRGIPTYGGSIQSELCTPTGAALIRHFADSFGDQPLMRVERVGYGMGSKEFERLNAVRALLGEEGGGEETVLTLSCCVDDMTAEEIGFACEMLFEAGARDVFTVPAYMKKSRPGTLIQVICTDGAREDLVKALFKHTSTLGVREARQLRHILSRDIAVEETPAGPVRIKRSEGYGTHKCKPEYEDVAAIARKLGCSFSEARRLIEKDPND